MDILRHAQESASHYSGEQHIEGRRFIEKWRPNCELRVLHIYFQYIKVNKFQILRVVYEAQSLICNLMSI